MLTATIRRVETVTVEVAGEGLDAVKAQLEAARPAGFDLVSAPVAMRAGTTALTATGVFARRDEVGEIEAETMDDLRKLIPEDWQMISVRRA